MPRLDTPICHSWYKKILFGLVIAVTLILMNAINVAVGAYVVLMAAGLTLWWIDTQKIALRHIAQTHDDKLWQFLVATHRGNQLWQGRIVHMTDCPYYVVLDVDVIEPKACHMRWTIFKDSVDMDCFRRLKALSRFY